MIKFFPYDGEIGYHSIIVTEEDKQRLLTVLKRGVNTLSPPDMEIIKLIQKMEGSAS